MYIKAFQITGDGSVHAFAATIGITSCKWAQVSSSAASLTIGGPDLTSSANGFPVGIGFSQFLPAISELSSRYDLTLCKYYAAAAETFTLLIGLD